MCVFTGNNTYNLHPTFITAVAWQHLRTVGSYRKSTSQGPSEARMWPFVRVAQATTDHRSTSLIVDKGEPRPYCGSGSAVNNAVSG